MITVNFHSMEYPETGLLVQNKILTVENNMTNQWDEDAAFSLKMHPGSTQ